MFGWFRSAYRHPLYPNLPVTHAAVAVGRHAVLAGTFQELAQAARRGACASRAVFVLHGDDAPPPGFSQREELWRWFPVPSYVLVVDANGRLKAYECEAHEGLHVPADWPGAGQFETAVCPCGRPGRKVSRVPDAGFPVRPKNNHQWGTDPLNWLIRVRKAVRWGMLPGGGRSSLRTPLESAAPGARIERAI